MLKAEPFPTIRLPLKTHKYLPANPGYIISPILYRYLFANMPSNIHAYPPSDASAPPADDEKTAVKVANTESFCVKYELLMLR
jgi:hypothetical protein